jgi:hypothetical protein
MVTYLIAQYLIVTGILNEKSSISRKCYFDIRYYSINEVIYFSITRINKFPKEPQKTKNGPKPAPNKNEYGPGQELLMLNPTKKKKNNPPSSSILFFIGIS